jgi:hypothetical protein
MTWIDRGASPLDRIQLLLEAWQAARRKRRKPAAQPGQLSTQQIMHPELYFDHPTPAKTVLLAGYGKVLRDWKKVDEDTLGELILKIMLERTMDEQTPYVEAATKWAGDRLMRYKKENH